MFCWLVRGNSHGRERIIEGGVEEVDTKKGVGEGRDGYEGAEREEGYEEKSREIKGGEG